MEPSLRENWSTSGKVMLDYKTTTSQGCPVTQHNGQRGGLHEGSQQTRTGTEAMMNTDVPISRFMKVINFEDLPSYKDQEAPDQNREGEDLPSYKDQEAPDQNREDLAGDLSQVGDNRRIGIHCPPQVIDNHSQLVERFQLLRHWQLQQQQHLMKQQHEQLQVLHGEQQRVQAMLAKQKREIHWGSPVSNQSVSLDLCSPKEFSPKKNCWQKPVCTQSIASVTSAMAIGSEALRYSKVVPETKSDVEYASGVISNLESNIFNVDFKGVISETESDIHSVELEEGVQPIQDTASEISDSLDACGDSTQQSGLSNELKNSSKTVTNQNGSVSQLIDARKDVTNLRDREAIGRKASSSDSKNTSNEPFMENQCSENTGTFDDRPINPRTKTFEEILAIELQQQNNLKGSLNETTKIKHTFLRKGQGIARFCMSTTPSRKPDIVEMTKNNQKSATPLSRKIATKSPRESKLGPVVLADSSFQHVMLDRACIEKYEQEELEEFELLEKYADASFMSHPSPLVKANWRAHMGTPKTAQLMSGDKAGHSAVVACTSQRHQDESIVGSDQDIVTDINDTVFILEHKASKSFEKNTLRKISSLDTRHISNSDLLDNDNQSSFSNTLMTKEQAEDNEPYIQESDKEKGYGDHFDFNDEESWDLKSTPLGNQLSHVAVPSLTPPTSQLISKLFPKLKKANSTHQITQQNGVKLHEVSNQPVTSGGIQSKALLDSNQPVTSDGIQSKALLDSTQPVTSDGIQSKALLDKLAELDTEIDKFKRENVALNNLRKKREEQLGKLKSEIEEFEKQKAEELQRIQTFRTQELKKIRNERRVFEQHQKAANALSDKKGREEIAALKQQMAELEEENKRKETRWTATCGRLRNRNEQLQIENSELKNEVNIIERKRLEHWQINEIAAKVPMTKAIHDASRSTMLTQRSSVPSELKTTIKNEPLDRFKDKVEDNSSENNSVADQIPLVVQLQRPSSADFHEKNKEDESLGKSIGVDSCHPTSEGLPMVTVISDDALPKKYSPCDVASKGSPVKLNIDKGSNDYEEEMHQDGKVEKIFTNGAREVVFPNGTKKEISADSKSIIVSFFNGDIKQIMPDGRVVYYYAEAQTTHTTHPDGMEILQFPNNQTEKCYADGTKEISFPDYTIKYLYTNGVEETVFKDGTVVRVDKDGEKTMEFPNGQREVHTSHFKRREYPDGTMKIIYPDGKQETHYTNGRVRLKDKLGHVLVDMKKVIL